MHAGRTLHSASQSNLPLAAMSMMALSSLAGWCLLCSTAAAKASSSSLGFNSMVRYMQRLLLNTRMTDCSTRMHIVRTASVWGGSLSPMRSPKGRSGHDALPRQQHLSVMLHLAPRIQAAIEVEANRTQGASRPIAACRKPGGHTVRVSPSNDRLYHRGKRRDTRF